MTLRLVFRIVYNIVFEENRVIKRLFEKYRILFALVLALSASANTTAQRKYAPDRKADIIHIIIDVTPDFENRTIKGVTAIRFAPIAVQLSQLRLDAIDLQVHSVTSSAAIDDYTATDEAITITFDEPIQPGAETTIEIAYEAEPTQGLYFRTTKQGYDAGDTHLFTQGESHTSPCWYPNYDYPNERSTSEVICRIPPEMTAISNGRLVSEQIDPDTGLKAVRWRQEKPHVNYLVALVAGYLDKIESKHRNIPLAFYTPKSQIHLAKNSFADTANMMAFFEKEIGIRYPWNKYYQAAVKDFVAGGMENTTLTILTDRTLFSNESENIHSSTGLVAHELVHQWFGDYVTCKDWSHLWLNEGFATYYQKLYENHKNGRDSFLYDLYKTAGRITSQTNEQRPIVHKLYDSEDEQFDYRNYSKGGWVLHMLRAQLGEKLYRKCVKTFLKRHALDSVVTEDFIAVIEELSGRSYDRFFDEWVRQGRFPELDVSYTWSGKDKLAKISIKQTQQPLNDVAVYHFDTAVGFIIDGEYTDRQVTIDAKQHDFYFALDAQPKIVRFDPQYTLLAKVNFDKPRAMLYEQLANDDDVIGQLLAVEALKKNKDKKTIEKLKDRLNTDAFHGVRTRASSALRDIGTDEAFAALTESTTQADARVRKQVIEDTGSFYRPESLCMLTRVCREEKNPDIRAAAIRRIGKFNSKETKKLLTDALKTDSFRNVISNAAVSAIDTMDDPHFIDILRKAIVERADALTPSYLGSALGTLGRISRNEEDKTNIREFLTGYVSHENRRIKAAAIGALGSLGDPKAIPLVEAFEGDGSRDRLQRSAASALRKLREQKPFAPQEVRELRKIVDDLKKDNDKLREEFEDLKKRLDAKEEPDDKTDTSDKQ